MTAMKTYKVNSHYFKLYHAYSISFNSSNVGKFCQSWIPNDYITFQEKDGKEKESCCFVFVFICILFLLHPIDNTLVVQYQLVQGWLNYVYIINKES